MAADGQNGDFAASERVLGVGQALASALLMASMPLLVRAAYEAGMSSAMVVALRMTFALAIVLFICKARGIRVVQSGETLRLCLLAGALYAVDIFGFYVALRYLPASECSMLFRTYPVMVLLLHVRRQAGLGKGWISAGLAIMGVACLFSDELHGGTIAPAVLLVLMAAVSYAIYATLLEREALKAVHPFALPVYTNGISLCVALVMLAVAPEVDVGIITPDGVGICAVIALMCTVLPMSLYIVAARRIGSSATALLDNVQPAITLALECLLAAMLPTASQLAGCLLIAAAGVLASLVSQRK